MAPGTAIVGETVEAVARRSALAHQCVCCPAATSTIILLYRRPPVRRQPTRPRSLDAPGTPAVSAVLHMRRAASAVTDVRVNHMENSRRGHRLIARCEGAAPGAAALANRVIRRQRRDMT